MDLVQWLPLVGGLGVGSVIGNWFGGGRARREVRSEVLKALAEVELTRWATDTNYRPFTAALRELETTALVARIPRKAVHHYTVLAEAARYLSGESFEEFEGDEEMGAGAIDGYYGGHVRQAAALITRCAWSPWLSRVTLSRDLNKLRSKVLAVDDSEVRQKIAYAQRTQGVLPGPLGELPGTKALPPMKEPEEN